MILFGKIRIQALFDFKELILSHKLQCYSGISSPEKSCNNTHAKNIVFFFTYFDIANQLLTCHSPLAPLSQVDKWTAKPSQFSIQVICLENPRIMAAKTLKNMYCWWTVRLKLSYKGKKTNILKEKLKVTYSVVLVLAFLSAENENWQLEDCHWLILADCLHERLLMSVRTKSINENFVNWTLRPLLVL